MEPPVAGDAAAHHDAPEHQAVAPAGHVLDGRGDHRAIPVAEPPAPAAVHPRGGYRRVLVGTAILAVLLLAVAELAVRHMGTLPPNRIWGDIEAQIKADHAEDVARRHGREELVVSGSSITDAGLAPDMIVRALGRSVTAWSYAQEGSAADTAALFLEAQVLDKVHPKVVVLGLTANDLNDNGLKATLGLDALVHSRGYRLATGHLTLPDRIDRFVERRSALVAHREELRDPYALLRWLRNPRFTSLFPYDPATGALLRDRALVYAPPPAYTKSDPEGPVYHQFHVGGKRLQAVERLARELHARGARLVVVEMPSYFPGLRIEAKHADRDVAEAHAAIVRATADAASCIDRIDLHTRLQDPSYWGDDAHVNLKGTEALSRMVGQWLRAHPPSGSAC